MPTATSASTRYDLIRQVAPTYGRRPLRKRASAGRGPTWARYHPVSRLEPIRPCSPPIVRNGTRRWRARWASARDAKFYRLFMVPGMTHCIRPRRVQLRRVARRFVRARRCHDVQTALERWVEKGVAPSGSSRPSTRMTRRRRVPAAHQATLRPSRRRAILGLRRSERRGSFVCRGGAPAGGDDEIAIVMRVEDGASRR